MEMTEQINKLSRLGLGTVQFGADYGISNGQGQSSFVQAREVLAEAHRQGLAVIDTSPAYGVSEEVVGRCLTDDHAFKIVTKTPVLGAAALTRDDAAVVKGSFYRSLQKLGQESLYALLVHHIGDLLAANGELLWDVMSDMKKWGLVEKIGVSAYSGDQIDRLLTRFPIDIVQVPLNVFDQRLVKSGYLAGLKKRGVEIHVRSGFAVDAARRRAGLLPTCLSEDGRLPQSAQGARPFADSGCRELRPQRAGTGLLHNRCER